jgi:hypothetical protein
MKTFQHHNPKVNILVVPIKDQWQAKVFRTDNAAMVYETTTSSDGLAVFEDAQKWAKANRYFIGSVSGIRLPQVQPTRLRTYSKSWGTT